MNANTQTGQADNVVALSTSALFDSANAARHYGEAEKVFAIQGQQYAAIVTQHGKTLDEHKAIIRAVGETMLDASYQAVQGWKQSLANAYCEGRGCDYASGHKAISRILEGLEFSESESPAAAEKRKQRDALKALVTEAREKVNTIAQAVQLEESAIAAGNKNDAKVYGALADTLRSEAKAKARKSEKENRFDVKAIFAELTPENQEKVKKQMLTLRAKQNEKTENESA